MGTGCSVARKIPIKIWFPFFYSCIENSLTDNERCPDVFFSLKPISSHFPVHNCEKRQKSCWEKNTENRWFISWLFYKNYEEKKDYLLWPYLFNLVRRLVNKYVCIIIGCSCFYLNCYLGVVMNFSQVRDYSMEVVTFGSHRVSKSLTFDFENVLNLPISSFWS